ncbi:MAG: molybdenum cofactor biosynthesis protein MoaB [Desulfobacteraceae bacterium]|nr:molybdenum cofactor biosynthesis protein MoaB [Desulfobacteraceae bacterium]
MGTRQHKASAPRQIRLGIISVSSTRSLAEDQSGQWIATRARKEGHQVGFHRVIPDDAAVIAQTLEEVLAAYEPQAVLITGGTGISQRDVTIEAIKPLFRKELSAFGVLFAQLSFEEIDSAAILSRATAGVIASAVVFAMPGSLRACQLACTNLIFPELGHLVGHLQEG